jgi:hypothetical protein
MTVSTKKPLYGLRYCMKIILQKLPDSINYIMEPIFFKERIHFLGFIIYFIIV